MPAVTRLMFRRRRYFSLHLLVLMLMPLRERRGYARVVVIAIYATIRSTCRHLMLLRHVAILRYADYDKMFTSLIRTWRYERAMLLMSIFDDDEEYVIAP